MPARFLAECERTPWALMPERYYAYRSVLHRWAAGEAASAAVMAQVRADREAREAKRASSTVAGGGGIAVLPLYGVVTQRGNMVDDLSGPGSVSTQMFSRALADAVADESVAQILIDVDSPGGSVFGVSELADEIYEARKSKPVVAIANSLAASAAYWLGSQASEFYMTPGGEVGSIGVIMAHADYSEQNAMEGVKVTYITAPEGGYKAEGNPDEPLSDDARAYEQGRVNEYYGAFTRAVARGRALPVATVRGSSFGRGRVLGADAALAAGMVDGIATFDQVIKRMRSKTRAAKSSATRSSTGRESAAAEVQHANLLARLRIAELE
jgi:capsid assembly protease